MRYAKELHVLICTPGDAQDVSSKGNHSNICSPMHRLIDAVGFGEELAVGAIK